VKWQGWKHMKKDERISRLITYSMLLAATGVLLFVPDRLLFNEDNIMCLHKMLLGIECPLCGMTRAAHDILHLRLVSAFHYNFTIYLLALLIIADAVYLIFPRPVWQLLRKVSLILLLTGLGIIYFLRIYSRLV